MILLLNYTMETWFLILTTLCVCALIKASLNLIATTNKPTLTLPPGPTNIPFISSILWLRKSFAELEPILRSLHVKFGPIVTIRPTTRPAIFIADRHLAYKALVQNGALFADRPEALPVDAILTTNQSNINSASYGSKWRILRRNLTSEILHPSRVVSYSHARNWVLEMLLNRLQSEAKSGAPVPVRDHIQYAMFCLLVLMCFGDKLEEKQIKEIERVECKLLVNGLKFNILNVMPKLNKLLFRKRWEQLFQLKKDVDDVLLPIITARKKAQEERLLRNDKKDDEYVLCYVDTLLQLELPEEKRKLRENEIVTLCNEFLHGGVDTTSTALEWIMANLVKYPEIQEKLFNEIKQVTKQGDEVIGEEDVQKMPYLKAVVLEGLRKHPPGHFVLPHAVTQETTLDKYLIPKNGAINFLVAEIGRDPKAWDDPMAFKPERFMNNNEGEGFDMTSSREIKMMPFGAGRRMCPGYALAMLHLEFLVANLVWSFEWKAMEGDDVDLSEKQEFTVVMKNPLKAHINKRFKMS